MTRAYSYLRVSGKSQVHGDGFPRQRDAIAAWASANGVELAGEYLDGGVTGTKGAAGALDGGRVTTTSELDDRPGLGEMLADAAREGVDLILVENSNRLARDLVVGEILLRDIAAMGIRVVACDCGEELTRGGDPSRVLIRQILGAVAEYEKSALVAKLRAARSRIRREKGRCDGRKPYGISKAESYAVDRMREMRGRGMTLRQIAAALDGMGLRPKHAEKWQAKTIARILSRNVLMDA